MTGEQTEKGTAPFSYHQRVPRDLPSSTRRAGIRQKTERRDRGFIKAKGGGLTKKENTAKKKTKGAETKKTARYKYSEWITEEGLIRVRGWAQDGASYEQIAKNIGIATSTLREWRERFPALSAALAHARDIADRKVENRLFDRTQGYTVQVKKAVKLKREWYDERGKKCVEERVEMVEEEEHIPADVKAQIYWLSNRKPQEWKNNPDGKQEEGELPDDGLKEQMETAASQVCAGTDDSDMLPESDDDGTEEDA